MDLKMWIIELRFMLLDKISCCTQEILLPPIWVKLVSLLSFWHSKHLTQEHKNQYLHWHLYHVHCQVFQVWESGGKTFNCCVPDSFIYNRIIISCSTDTKIVCQITATWAWSWQLWYFFYMRLKKTTRTNKKTFHYYVGTRPRLCITKKLQLTACGLTVWVLNSR